MIYIKNNTEIQTIFIPRNELQKEAYNATVKTYEDGYNDGLEDGKEYQKDQLLNLYVTKNGQYEREDGWGVVTVDIPIGDCPECEDCSGAYDEGYEIGKNEGYEDGFQNGYNQGQADCPDCEDCPELTTIDITENGSYEGAFNLVNVNVPQNGGECNLEDKWVTPTMSDRDDNGLIVIEQSEGYDGLDRVVLDPQNIYNEGVEEGKNQGGGESGGDAELGVLDVVLEEPYTQVFDAKERDGLDGYSVVNVRPEGLVERERNNAVEDFKNKMDSITITQNGSYGVDHLTNYPYLDYENVDGYTEFHYTPNDDNFEIEVSYSLSSDPAVMHLVDIGEYSVVIEAGMCYGAKNDERISPEHMSWGIEDRTIHTIKVTREGITLLDDGSFIFWGEDLGTIDTNIRVGRDFTFKVFTVKINGETFTPEGDGVFTNSFAIGEAARYGELQTSDYPNGFRNVEVNIEFPDVNDYTNVQLRFETYRGDLFESYKNTFDFTNCFYNNNNEVIPNEDFMLTLTEGFPDRIDVRCKQRIKYCYGLPIPSNLLYGFETIWFDDLGRVYLTDYGGNTTTKLILTDVNELSMSNVVFRNLVNFYAGVNTFSISGCTLGTEKESPTLYPLNDVSKQIINKLPSNWVMDESSKIIVLK